MRPAVSHGYSSKFHFFLQPLWCQPISSTENTRHLSPPFPLFRNKSFRHNNKNPNKYFTHKINFILYKEKSTHTRILLQYDTITAESFLSRRMTKIEKVNTSSKPSIQEQSSLKRKYYCFRFVLPHEVGNAVKIIPGPYRSTTWPSIWLDCIWLKCVIVNLLLGSQCLSVNLTH